MIGASSHENKPGRAPSYGGWPRPDGEEIAPAEPLTAITGMLDEEAADEARQRSEEWREEFDDELSPGNEA